MASPFNREVARERVNARLGRRDVKLHRRAEIMQRRADVQDLTVMFLQLFEGGATNIERSLEIDIHHRAKAVRRQLFRRAQEISRRAVHDNIDLAKVLDRGGNRFRDFIRVAHVGGYGESLCRPVR